MRPRGGVTSNQVGVTAILLVLSSAILFVPGLVSKTAGRDAWLSILLSGAVSVAFAYVLFRLFFVRLKSPLTVARELGGKGVYAAMGVITSLFSGWLAMLVLRETSMVYTITLRDMPLQVFIAGLAFTSWVLAAYGGETVLRSGQVLAGLVVLAFVFTLVAALPHNAQLTELEPVLENGPGGVISAMPVFLAFTGELVFMAFFADRVIDVGQVWSVLLWSVVIIVAIAAGLTAATTVVLGPTEVSRSILPVLVLARQIRLTEFFSRLEVLIITAWLMGTFVKLAVLLYVSGASLQEGLGLNIRWRLWTTSSFTVFAGILSYYLFPDQLSVLNHLGSVWPIAIGSFTVVVLVVGLLAQWVTA